MYFPPKYPLTLNALDEISSIYNLVEESDKIWLNLIKKLLERLYDSGDFHLLCIVISNIYEYCVWIYIQLEIMLYTVHTNCQKLKTDS